MSRAGHGVALGSVAILVAVLLLVLRPRHDAPEVPSVAQGASLEGSTGEPDLDDVNEAGIGRVAATATDAPVETATTASAAPAIPGERTIRVTVIDGQDLPLAGASVVARPDARAGFEDWGFGDWGFGDWGFEDPAPATPDCDATTDEEGRAELLVPDDRSWVVQASLPDRPPVRSGSVAPGAEVRLVLARGAALEGFVTLAGDGHPIPEAVVRIHHGPEGDELVLATTDARGYYAARGLSAGEGGVLVVPREHALARWRAVSLVEDETARVDVAVEVGWTVGGSVTDATTGDPIAGAEVSPWEFIGKIEHTDEQGRFRIAGVRTRPGVLSARAPGYGRGEVSYVDARQDLDVALHPGLLLTGRVVDPAGALLAEAKVTAVALVHEAGLRRREWASTRTRADGRFTIPDVRSDLPLSLGVRRAGYGGRAIALPGHGAGATLDVGDVTLAPQLLVEGRVLTAAGEPAAGAGVFLEGPTDLALPGDAGFHLKRRTASADDRGRFLFAGLVAGRWELRAHIGGGRTIDERLDLEPGEPRRVVELRMPGGVPVHGRVTDPAGGPLPGAFVMLMPEEGRGVPILAAECNASGEFEIENVPEGGTFSARVSMPEAEGAEGDDARVWAPLVQRGLTADGRPLRFELVPLDAWIEGVVVDGSGRPIPSALVAREEDGPGLGAGGAVLTDEAGRFRIRAPAGRGTSLVAWRTEALDGGEVTATEWRLGRRPLGEAPAARLEGVRAEDAEVRLVLTP